MHCRCTESRRFLYDSPVFLLDFVILFSLHRNRTASSFLIPRSEDFDEWKSDDEDGSLFNPGSYACPVKFKTAFPLYERCVANQVVMSLEASVLHSFAVSNRRGVFVYKDESQAIFYMKLKEVIGNDDDDSVEFLVFGLKDPGPSVTNQLTTLLQRKVHLLAVDALSTVLTKNPHLKWKPTDVSFLRSFRDSYQPSDDEKALSSYEKIVEYAVPDYMYDPVMLLLLFRQNICGSTFFHRLQEAGSDDNNNFSITAPAENSGDALVTFDPRDFTLFYNNAPSPLDPDYQPVCTLTEKGKLFSAKTGIGIALLNVTLVDRNDHIAERLHVGQSPTEPESGRVSKDTLLRLQRVEGDVEMPQYRIRVSIADTALDREALHGWVELTLNQVLVAWVVERHIECSQRGLLEGQGTIVQRTLSTDEDRRMAIDSLEPGFPHLFDMLQESYDLPHPAIELMELGGVVKASSVSNVALSLLERCFLGLMSRKEVPAAPEDVLNGISQTTVIRLSRSQQPTPVNLVWDSRREKAQVTQSGRVSMIQDSPIDCPEYVCFYCFDHYSDDNDSDSRLPPSSMCFREIMVDDKSDGRKHVPFRGALQSLRKRNPSSFSRSLVFVLSVKRNRRQLLTYNWNPEIWKR